MATRQIKKTSVASATDATAITTTTEEKKVVEKKKEFKPSDVIPCRSITVGGLYMEGLKTHLLYEWSDSGDITYVEYQDLLAAIMSNSGYITRPLFIIEDDDLVKQHQKLSKIYETMYSFNELSDVILKLNVSDMKATILSLPDGAKNSLKHTASQLVSNKTLDSVSKIKALDEIFGTELTLMAGL